MYHTHYQQECWPYILPLEQTNISTYNPQNKYQVAIVTCLCVQFLTEYSNVRLVHFVIHDLYVVVNESGELAH